MAFIDNNDKLTLRVYNMAVSHLDTFYDKEDDEADRPTWTYQLHDYPDAIVTSSKVVARRPRLLERAGQANKVDKILSFEKPAGQEFCSGCGEWRPQSYFVKNASRKRGYDYECKQCKRQRMDAQRLSEIIADGREKRRYYKAA